MRGRLAEVWAVLRGRLHPLSLYGNATPYAEVE